MNQSVRSSEFQTLPELLEAYENLKVERPKARTRDLTNALGLGEAQLLAARVGSGITRLRVEPEQILKGIKALGKVMALTRNEEVVHERKGVYDNLSFNHQGKMHIGLALNPDIDLRLFLHHWVLAFAVTESSRGRTLNSIQFFDAQGTAIHKIYCTEDSDLNAYQSLVEQFKDEDQAPSLLSVYPIPVPEATDLDKVDVEAFRQAWRDLKDVHDFHPLLRKMGLDRTTAFELVQGEFTQPVAPEVLPKVLERARDKACEIMVFVGNRGCIQIHTGPVNHLMPMDTWFNVMDPDFNLHAQMSDIASAWVVRKPSSDGTITSIECFNAEGDSVATFFGKRKPGIPELELWRDIVAELEIELRLEA